MTAVMSCCCPNSNRTTSGSCAKGFLWVNGGEVRHHSDDVMSMQIILGRCSVERKKNWVRSSKYVRGRDGNDVFVNFLVSLFLLGL